ncbi:MAG: NAD-dependent dihydropyrimidine dehydrogenase subunit PreA [Chloroflexi bacterium]|nr:NAD-dependent dihydropyrimidine dehydrogenase subunit PreA [Chloroflexota bacterium]MDA8189713.1 NAD-dependent dihydropyrimidine dehydrogenase subunit PreA [Dehalococcoidales bacterium]
MADLSVDFLGKELPNPFLLASAPPAATGPMIQRAFAAGWAGAVTKTLSLQEIVNVRPRLGRLPRRGRLLALENIELISDRPLATWLEEMTEIKRLYPDRMLVASLMAAVDREEWHRIVSLVEEAGADAVELNLGCPHGMPERGMGAIQGQDPTIAADITFWVKEVATTPVIVKLTPNVTDISTIARAVKAAGADAVAAINTVACLVGIDLETLRPLPAVHGQSAFGGLSGPAIKPIALRCVAEIARAVSLPVSGMGGINDWQDAAEFLLLGATTLQVCTAVMLRGYGLVGELARGLSEYMDRQGFTSVAAMAGKVLPRIKRFEELDLDHRVVATIDAERCNGCQLCYTACQDGAYAAIAMAEGRTAQVSQARCDGCGLCAIVCPVPDCIRLEPVATQR